MKSRSLTTTDHLLLERLNAKDIKWETDLCIFILEAELSFLKCAHVATVLFYVIATQLSEACQNLGAPASVRTCFLRQARR